MHTTPLGSPRRRFALLAVPALLTLALGACSSGGGEEPGSATAPRVTLEDFDITMDPMALTAGEVTMTATNNGPSVHEFEVFRGEGGDDLPVSSGVADTSGLDLVDELEDIAPGTRGELTLTLEPGTYALICNLAGHYEQGMHLTFTVG
jgi:uncharacterized cupredoxin-like copper-binding protein